MGFFDRFKGTGANSDDEIKRYAQRTQTLLLARNRDWQQFLAQKLAETEAKITTVSKMGPAGLLDEDDDFDEMPDAATAVDEPAQPAPGGAPDLGDENNLNLNVSLWQAQDKTAAGPVDDDAKPAEDEAQTEGHAAPEVTVTKVSSDPTYWQETFEVTQ